MYVSERPLVEEYEILRLNSIETSNYEGFNICPLISIMAQILETNVVI